MFQIDDTEHTDNLERWENLGVGGRNPIIQTLVVKRKILKDWVGEPYYTDPCREEEVV